MVTAQDLAVASALVRLDMSPGKLWEMLSILVVEKAVSSGRSTPDGWALTPAGCAG